MFSEKSSVMAAIDFWKHSRLSKLASLMYRGKVAMAADDLTSRFGRLILVFCLLCFEDVILLVGEKACPTNIQIGIANMGFIHCDHCDRKFSDGLLNFLVSHC